MMDLSHIEGLLGERICHEVRIFEEGTDRYRIFVPFYRPDGDGISVTFKKMRDSWVFTDEASTFMHLSINFEQRHLNKGRRSEIIDNTIDRFGVTRHGGELRLPIESVDNAGRAFFHFLQCLTRLTDLDMLKPQSRTVSHFSEDFKSFVRQIVPAGRANYEWYHPGRDKKKLYEVDVRVNGIATPLFLFALTGNGRTRDATISILNFEQWGLDFRSVGVFEDEEKISQPARVKFQDASDSVYSNLEGNRERIAKHIQGHLG